MGFFSTILANRSLSKHDGQSLWKYNLSDYEFAQLQSELNQVRLYNLDARDATLYFAEWWKRIYDGGSPKIQDVFNSLGREEIKDLTADVLYEYAKIGAREFGIKWIQKQNTLYFRTLLLQGGIPIKHVAENKSYYQAFLLALLELKPNTIEEIALQPELLRLLPVSSRNDTIYENCLSIINSILNDEDTYTALFQSNSVLNEIQTALQVRKHQLSKTARAVRPKIFWVMDMKDSVAKIYLRMGFGSKYTAYSLSEILNLSKPADDRIYHLYLDERLVCSFRKTLGGDYRTEWENQNFFRWNSAGLSPQFYCVCNDDRWEISDLIPVHPTIHAPTLWTDFGDNEWRLVKGNAVNCTNALLLLPLDWQHSAEQNVLISIEGYSLNAIQFEGEISANKAGLTYKYYSNVDAFEWNIKSEKPSWMQKADLVIVTNQLRLHVYDSEGKIVTPKSYKVHFRSAGSNNLWHSIDTHNQLPLGLIDIKIERNSIIAYDTAYNVGTLNLEIADQKLDCATLIFNHQQAFNITLAESSKFFATSNNNSFRLQLNTEQLSVPDSIPFKLKYGNQKALNFDIGTPFSGIGLVDKDGILLKEGTILTFNDLQGIRILTTNTVETIVKLWNKLRDQVIISKTIRFSHPSLLNFKEELQRLFYLADSMKHDNIVMIEVLNRNLKRSYCVKEFSHTINDVSTQFERKILMAGTDEPLQLFAVPLNCEVDSIGLLGMQTDADNYHHLPENIPNGQFIVISNKINGKQLQPRFINTDPTYEGKSPSERISQLHSVLLEADYSSLPWKELQAYYTICLKQQIPFSTFDQIRAISRSSKLAAKAFFFLGINQENTDEFIQNQIIELEQDLGFCFHWIQKKDWENAIGVAEEWIGSKYYAKLVTLIANYFHENNMDALYKYIGSQRILSVIRITNQIISEARAQLGERILTELPQRTPHTTSDYNIPVANNHVVKLLLRAPIAVAESIKGNADQSIWEDNEFVSILRRNIQYAHFVAPDLYTKVLYHCLSLLN